MRPSSASRVSPGYCHRAMKGRGAPMPVSRHHCRLLVVAATMMLLVLLLLAQAAAGSPLGATFDERQEGKLNVQIDVKDVQIVALVDSDMLEDYTNYDYAYDYADFTIKPRPTTSSRPSPSTDSPQTSGESPTTTTAARPSSPAEQLPAIGNSTILVIPELVVNASEPGTTTTTTATTTTTTTTTTAAKTANSTSLPAGEIGKPIDGENKRIQAMPEPRKRCPVGFFLKSGRCFKRRLSVISPRLAMMKLAPGLLGK